MHISCEIANVLAFLIAQITHKEVGVPKDLFVVIRQISNAGCHGGQLIDAITCLGLVPEIPTEQVFEEGMVHIFMGVLMLNLSLNP